MDLSVLSVCLHRRVELEGACQDGYVPQLMAVADNVESPGVEPLWVQGLGFRVEVQGFCVCGHRNEDPRFRFGDLRFGQCESATSGAHPLVNLEIGVWAFAF